jgi:hypothetical protein
MNKVVQDKTENVIVITNVNGKVQRFILSALGVIIFGLPVLGLILSIFNNDPEGSGGLFVGLFAYVLFMLIICRFLFWGLWGKETIYYGGDSLRVQYDYKLWKSKIRTFKLNSDNFSCVEDKYEHGGGQYKIIFGSLEDGYQSVLSLKTQQIYQLSGFLSIKNDKS